MALTKLTGAINPLPSPFNEGIIDVGSLVNTIEYVNSAQVDGYRINGHWLFGATGEFEKLTEDERLAYLAAVPFKKGHALLLVNVTAKTLEESIRFSEHAHDAEADAIVVMPDYMPNIDYVQHVESLVKSIKSPIVLYVNPDLSGGRKPSDEEIGYLSQKPRVIGMKVSGTINDFLGYAQFSSEKFGVLQGSNSQLKNSMNQLRVLEKRIDGVVLGAINFDPHLIIKIINGLATEDDWDKMAEISQAYKKRGDNIAYIKEHLLRIAKIKSAELIPSDRDTSVIIAPTISDTIRYGR